MSIPEYRSKFDSMTDGEQSSDQVSVAGRVMNYRASSAKLIFLDLVGDGEKIQVSRFFIKQTNPKSSSCVIVSPN